MLSPERERNLREMVQREVLPEDPAAQRHVGRQRQHEDLVVALLGGKPRRRGETGPAGRAVGGRIRTAAAQKRRKRSRKTVGGRGPGRRRVPRPRSAVACMRRSESAVAWDRALDVIVPAGKIPRAVSEGRLRALRHERQLESLERNIAKDRREIRRANAARRRARKTRANKEAELILLPDETVSRIITKFRHHRLITADRKSIKILNAKGLQAVADSYHEQ